MADVAQVIYEYAAASTISFKTNDLTISYHRYGFSISRRPDGKMHTDDPGIEYRKFTFSAIISGVTMNILNTVQMAAITYSGLYPRLTTINLDGDTTLSNIEIAITSLSSTDLGNGWWGIQCTMEEKTD